MEALWLKSQGLPHKQITRLTGISPNTFRAYLRQYQTGGLSALKQLNYHQQERVKQIELMSSKGRLRKSITSINVLMKKDM